MLHEPTTSITDFMLGLETLILAAFLINGGNAFPSLPFWTVALILLGVAAILGGFAHGMSRPVLFLAIYPCLALIMAMFVMAALTDIFGVELAQRARWPVGILVLAFALIVWRFPKYIQISAVLEAVIMVLALIFYLRMALNHSLPGSGHIAAGIVITIVAVVLLLRDTQLKIVYTFDRNGIYHLVQMVGVLFFYLGLSLRMK